MKSFFIEIANSKTGAAVHKKFYNFPIPKNGEGLSFRDDVDIVYVGGVFHYFRSLYTIVCVSATCDDDNDIATLLEEGWSKGAFVVSDH